MGVNQWLRVFDTVSNLAQLSGKFRKPSESDAAPFARAESASGGGPLAQLETRLAGVVVAALKEAFDRDRARMDLERAHLDAERAHAEEALRAELRRQAGERALGQVRLVALMSIGVWIVSAGLGVWLPGMRGGLARDLLAGGWVLVIAALGCSFAAWQRISTWTSDARAAQPTAAGPGFAERMAPWLLLGALGLSGAALLAAL